MKQTRCLALLGLLATLLLTASCTRNAERSQDSTSSNVEEPHAESSAAPSGSNRKAATAPVAAAQKPETRLRFEPAENTGLEFLHVAGRSPELYMPEILGGGLLIADFNRDAAPDVLFVNSGQTLGLKQRKPMAHCLFVNNGNGTFIDQTAAWKLGNAGYGMGGAVGDFDNDGWTDLYLTTFDGHDKLLRNTGDSFQDVTDPSGLPRDSGWSTSAGFFDMDDDGDLDLYVVKYVDYSLESAIPCFFQGVHIHCTPVMFAAEADRLYRNDGDGKFTDVSESAGIPTGGKGLALAIGDVDSDGDSDLYVANDTTPNFLLINDGQGKFEEKAGLLGVGYSSFGKEEAGMGADFFDVNDDGLVDIVCANFQGETTSVYIQQPQGYFFEQSDELGVGKTARQRLSFGLDFFDADNDGDEDLLVANGHIYIDAGKFSKGTGFGQKNTLYEQRDRRLLDVTESAGTALQTEQPSRGLATGDLDNDGDLDFVVVNNDTKAEVALNVSQDLGNFVSLWLEGTEGNRSAIGAVVSAKMGDRTITRAVLGASSYLSACDHRVHLGLGTANQIDELIVRWPGGKEQSVSDLPANTHYHWIEGQDPVAVQPGQNVIAPK